MGTAATLFGRGSRGLETSAPIAEQRKNFLIPSCLTAESPDMKNVYDGIVVLDNKGEAEIELPNWFVYSIRIFAISLLLSELLDLISTLQRKFLTRLQATKTKTTIVASRLQEVLQVWKCPGKYLVYVRTLGLMLIGLK